MSRPPWIRRDETIQLHVSVRADMAEIETWRPEQIAAFLGGVARVLAATGARASVPTKEP